MKLLNTIILTLILVAINTLSAQIYVRGGVGTGIYKSFGKPDSRTLPWTVVGEWCKIMPELGNGIYLSYSNYRFKDDSGTIQELPGISIGSSNSIYIYEALAEFMSTDKLPLYGKLSPYISLLIGLNLGAGFSSNDIYIDEYGNVNILTARIPIGVAFYPVNWVGGYVEFFGPQTKINFGLTFRFGYQD